MLILHLDPVFLQIVDDPAGHYHLGSPSSDAVDLPDECAFPGFFFQLRRCLFPYRFFILALPADDTDVLMLLDQRIELCHRQFKSDLAVFLRKCLADLKYIFSFVV